MVSKNDNYFEIMMYIYLNESFQIKSVEVKEPIFNHNFEK